MAVAKNIALPSPQTPRSTESCTMLSLNEARIAATPTTETPVMSTGLKPNRPLASVAGIMPRAMTAMYAVNSSSTCQAVTPIASPMAGRIGSTTAMPAMARKATSVVA